MIETSKRFRRFCLCVLLGFTPAGLAENEAASPSSGNLVLKNFPIKANQGVAVDEHWFYAISNTRITKCDKQSGKVVAEWEADRQQKAQAHFKHLNSGTVVGNLLYCAHSRFPLAPNDCTVEIFSVGEKSLEHKTSIAMPATHGSLTWIDRRSDNTWWMCFAVYGKDSNKKTKLVKYRLEDGTFIEEHSSFFPEEVVANWGTMSSSGGSWGPDGKLYVTGHDHAEAYVLEVGETGGLHYIRTEKDLGLYGQAIAWDRFSSRPVLWGIVKDQHISQTLIPAK